MWEEARIGYISHALSLNLQAWRIPLWGVDFTDCIEAMKQSQPPSLENPFVGLIAEIMEPKVVSLNLQAWRIPLWVSDS